MQQDEWVVSRVFRKSAGVKKYYPSLNPTRAVMNNPYNINLEVAPNSMNMPPPSMMQLGLDSAAALHNFHLYGRNYINTPDQVAEVTRLLRAGVVPMHQYSHLNFPVSSSSSPLDGGGFTISGLNLNLGGATSSHSQPILRPMPSTTTTNAHMAAHQLHDYSSNMISNNNNSAVGYGGGEQVNNPNPNGHRYNMQGTMDHCVDLDNYWPPSY